MSPADEGLGSVLERVARALRDEMGRDPVAVRRRALDLVRTAARSEVGIWYAFGLVDGEPFPSDWIVDGTGDEPFSRWLEERLPWPGGDPRLPQRSSRDRFVTMGAIFQSGALERTALHQRCIVPMGVTDQIRMMLYFRGRHVGWIGAMRGRGEARFGDPELRRLRRVTSAVSAALVHADALAGGVDPSSAADLILDPSGRVELASSEAAPILAHPERATLLSRWARAAERGDRAPPILAGMRAHWSRLTGPCGSRYLVHLEPVERIRLSPAFELSATQRRVAEHAASGCRVAEIAEALGIAPTTVRTHLRAIYETLGIGSRAELACAFSAGHGASAYNPLGLPK